MVECVCQKPLSMRAIIACELKVLPSLAFT